VTVCSDCIINDLGACGTKAAQNLGDPCNPYQDGIVDCCDTAGGGLICPAPAT
jgi:hypothetical protein